MNTANISVNTQSSIRIEGPKILYFDPFKISGESHDADMIFITHSHSDHLDPQSLRRIIRPDTVLIAPVSTEREIRKASGKTKLVLMAPGEKKDIDGLSVHAVPAYNSIKPFHPRRYGWNGYVVTMDSIRYYVAGDTDANRELFSVACDVALVPIGGVFTMSAKEAAKLVNAIRPQMAIPTHYGSIVGKPEDADVFRKFVDLSIEVETKFVSSKTDNP